MVKLLLIVFSVCLTAYAKSSEPPRTVECVSEQVDVWEFRPYPADCNLYIICMNGVGIVLQCPDELYFDPESELCDLPENVDCVAVTDSPPETEEPPTPPPTEEPGCNDRCVLQSSIWGGEVPDANDCSRFVNCMDNCKGATLTCPVGLYFNHLLSVCDLPERSECLLEVCVDQPIGLLASVNSCGQYVEGSSSCLNRNFLKINIVSASSCVNRLLQEFLRAVAMRYFIQFMVAFLEIRLNARFV